ncbi:DUF7472 family protein [Candidatus Halobonum tyrrellensis]|uniref:Transporter n=1 Tax=Candidatus Halobonum tyrrellensis G22 TaxID=1324957 RepID=V4GR16_9EURY|nr:hypothetical protein [Candidatus Halobonum tyrrellensis]ESP87496.1 transporter [Candidatus Halobonum tyrrellensis G22]
MDIDAEMRRKILVSLGAVVVYIALLVAVGITYTTDHLLSLPGAYLIVGIVALFVVMMAAAGLFIDRR